MLHYINISGVRYNTVHFLKLLNVKEIAACQNLLMSIKLANMLFSLQSVLTIDPAKVVFFYTEGIQVYRYRWKTCI